MATTRDALIYLTKHYPKRTGLTVEKLTQLLYLADWKSAIERGQQITASQWTVDESGPVSTEVQEIISRNETLALVDPPGIFTNRDLFGLFLRRKTSTPYVTLQRDAVWSAITHEEREILDFVIRTAATKDSGDFAKLVFSTYPLLYPSDEPQLDLVSLAKEYKDQQLVVSR